MKNMQKNNASLLLKIITCFLWILTFLLVLSPDSQAKDYKIDGEFNIDLPDNLNEAGPEEIAAFNTKENNVIFMAWDRDLRLQGKIVTVVVAKKQISPDAAPSEIKGFISQVDQPPSQNSPLKNVIKTEVANLNGIDWNCIIHYLESPPYAGGDIQYSTIKNGYLYKVIFLSVNNGLIENLAPEFEEAMNTFTFLDPRP